LFDLAQQVNAAMPNSWKSLTTHAYFIGSARMKHERGFALS
jgi:hypothetical protein